MQRVCNIGLHFLPKSRIDKRYWFEIHRVVTNFKPITFIGNFCKMAARITTCYSDAESSLSFLCFKVTNWAILYCIEFVWTKRNPNLTSFVRKSHIFCDAKAFALTCTVLLHSSTCRFTFLVPMSICMQCLISSLTFCLFYT